MTGRQIRGFTVDKGAHCTVALVRGGKRVLLSWAEAEALAVSLQAEALRALERKHVLRERAAQARRAKAAHRAIDALDEVVPRRLTVRLAMPWEWPFDVAIRAGFSNNATPSASKRKADA